ncbi:MAG: IS5 family transposase [Planctomycetia bacterium]|nr:IS5 family transposase [Planctomycetia bacterium]
MAFFREDKRSERLEELGNRLEFLQTLVPWEELFRKDVEKVHSNTDPKLGGRPPCDALMLFKISVLQSLYNLSDKDMEYQIADRLSFQKFLGIKSDARVPDSNTIRLFREKLKTLQLEVTLFHRFERFLQQTGFRARGGQIVDATFTHVPVRRKPRKKDDEANDDASSDQKPETPTQRSHRDEDACWTKKRNVSHFGYKTNVCVDVGSKFIRNFCVCPANEHDSRHFEELLDPKSRSRKVYADSAYVGKTYEDLLIEMKFSPQIGERPYRNRPLSQRQKNRNRKKSHDRIRVEHVFGQMSQFCRGRQTIHVLGLAQVKVKQTLACLGYNLMRYIQLKKKYATA